MQATEVHIEIGEIAEIQKPYEFKRMRYSKVLFGSRVFKFRFQIGNVAESVGTERNRKRYEKVKIICPFPMNT